MKKMEIVFRKKWFDETLPFNMFRFNKTVKIANAKARQYTLSCTI
jgi:hypothetical protein